MGALTRRSDQGSQGLPVLLIAPPHDSHHITNKQGKAILSESCQVNKFIALCISLIYPTSKCYVWNTNIKAEFCKHYCMLVTWFCVVKHSYFIDLSRKNVVSAVKSITSGNRNNLCQ